ncbi:MAG: calcium-binding protein, partial [Allosphingosinicella sp.]
MSETIVINENVGHVTQIVARTATGTARLFSIVGGADADRFRLDPETGALSFLQLPDFENPSDQDLGNLYEVIVRISDGEVEEEQSLSVEVADVDEAVDLDDSSGFAVARSENDLWVYDFNAVDPEGRPIVYSISGEDAHLFTIDASSGVLSFVAPPDYEAPFAGDRPNNYSVDVTASDGVTSDSVYLQVIVVNDNEPIAITSFGGAAAASLAASENQVFVAMITAADVDGDSPWYAIVGGADAARFRLDYLGRLTFRAPPDHENPTDSDGDNVYEVIVSASDGEFSDTQTLFVAVADEQWVTITSSEGADSASVSVAENGGTLVGTVAAVAEGGAPVSYSLAGGADAHLFTIDGTTGVLRFRWWPDFERPEDADGDNVYDVVVRASGGSAGDDQSLAIQVLDFASDLHIVSNGGGDEATIGVSENQSAVTVVQTGGGATPSYSLIGDDAHLFAIDAGGALRFIAAPNFEAPA